VDPKIQRGIIIIYLTNYPLLFW